MKTMQPVAREPIKGADVLAHGLVALGVTTVFCYPGGANLEVLDALSRVDIRLIRTEHEQGAVFAAQGYARSSGRLGVCLATSGPGATNLVTGIADANSDSIPILAITGNVATTWLGRNAFQEVNIVSVVTPITKLAIQVGAVEEIARALSQACRTALEGRPGPVLLDIPKDVQQAALPAMPMLDGLDMSRHTSTFNMTTALSAEQVETVRDLLRSSKRPVIYAGGGVISSDTGPLLVKLAERLACPVALTIMGLGAMPANHSLMLGPLGMHGAQMANVAVNEADLVLALGVRFDDRVIGDPEAFAHAARIVHIDVDANEIGKNKPVYMGVTADLRYALWQLLEIAVPLETSEWQGYLARVGLRYPLEPKTQEGVMTGASVIACLAGHLPADAIVTTGVGQHQMWAMQHCQVSTPRGFLSSSGFGTMGFGLPAAIGAKVASPSSTVIDIDGDGSLNMVINELSTCRRNGIAVKVVVINNQWLGMVRQWQDMIYASNRVVSATADMLFETDIGEKSAPYPDFLAIAAGYGVAAERITDKASLPAAFERMLADPAAPYLLDVMVERESDVFPMIPAGRSYRDVIFARGEDRIDDA